MRADLCIVGLGEALFDVFGADRRLGGAPLNVAVHAHGLGRQRGIEGVVVSRIGDDTLGHETLAALRDRGMTDEYLQTDPDRPTGRVYVTLNGGEPGYEIVENVAWDNLQWDPQLDELARRCDAAAFGSLAQRDGQARGSIQRFVEASRHAVRLFDVNLRQEFYDDRILRRSCELATAIKLNQDELGVVCDALAIDGDEPERRLLDDQKLQLMVLTRGADGTRLITPDTTVDGEPAPFEPDDDADAVGAGDSVAAAVLTGLCLRMPHQAIADAANAVGAFVAGRPGATPDLPDDLVARFH